MKRFSTIIKVGLKNGSPDAKPIQLNTKAFRDFVSFDQYFNLTIHFKCDFNSAYKNNFRKKNLYTISDEKKAIDLGRKSIATTTTI